MSLLILVFLLLTMLLPLFIAVHPVLSILIRVVREKVTLNSSIMVTNSMYSVEARIQLVDAGDREVA